MRKRKFLLVTLLFVMALTLLSLSGCEKGGGQPVGEAQDFNVVLYYINEEYLVMGDESLDKYKPPYEAVINATAEDVYLATLQELRNKPEAGYDTTLTEDIKFNDVHLDGNKVIVDFDSIGLNGGSYTETCLISQIVETLVNSFDQVEEVQFLVDGEQVESLMGHVDTSQPFEKGLF